MRSRLISCPRRILWLLAFWAWGLAVVRAEEPAARMELQLVRGKTCLDDVALRERLVSWLGTWPTDSSLRLEVRGSAHDPRTVVLRLYRLEFTGTPPDAATLLAERRFSPGPVGCSDLHDALAIAGSMMVKVALVPAQPPAEPPPEPTSEEPAPPSTAPEAAIVLPAPSPHDQASTARPAVPPPKLTFVAAKKKPVPRGRVYLLGSAALALDVGASPGGGGRLAAGLPIGQGFEIRLGVLGLVSRLNDLHPTSGRYRTKLLSGSIDLCRNFPTAGAVSVRLCAGYLPGLLRASGFDFASTLDTSLFWPAISAELELAIRLNPSWSTRLSVAPVYALRDVTLAAQYREDGSVAGKAQLPQLGVLFAIGFAYEISRQGSTHSEHQGL